MLHQQEIRIVQLETTVSHLNTDMQRLKDELAVYQAGVIGANKKMDAILVALVGDEAMKTKGLAHRIEAIESVVEWVKELKWKAVGAGIVIGGAWAVFMYLLEKFWK